MTLSDLRRYLDLSNVAAFLRVIRERESSQDDSAYTVLNGGAHFFDFAAHPYKGQRTPPGKAAGAYQFIASTWGDVEQQYGMPDFSPASQDAGAVARLIYRGALDDVMAGRFEAAVAKCRHEWTSLPGAAESSGTWTMAKALAVYRQRGGRTEDELAALRPGLAPFTTNPVPQPTQAKEPRMGGLAAAGLIGQLLQTVVGAFAPAARAKVEQAAGKVTDEAGAKVLADGLMGVVQQITGLTDPVQATAAVTAPTPEAKAKLAQVEQVSMLKIDELAGFLDRIAALEAQAAAATEASRAAARGFATPESWVLRMKQVSFTQWGLGIASIVVGLLTAWQMFLSTTFTPDPALMVLLTAIVMGLVNTFRDQTGFSFGGTVDSNATAIARDELAARRQQGAKQ